MAAGQIAVHPATAERFDDFTAVMTPKGGSGGCWCMLWRLTAKAFAAGKGDGHRAAMRRLFEAACCSRRAGLSGWCPRRLVLGGAAQRFSAVENLAYPQAGG